MLSIDFEKKFEAIVLGYVHFLTVRFFGGFGNTTSYLEGGLQVCVQKCYPRHGNIPPPPKAGWRGVVGGACDSAVKFPDVWLSYFRTQRWPEIISLIYLLLALAATFIHRGIFLQVILSMQFTRYDFCKLFYQYSLKGTINIGILSQQYPFGNNVVNLLI